MRRPRRGRRPKGRTSIAQSPAQLTAQSTAPCSAQRGAKTVAGFRARKTDTVQSSPQFSASCQPHCGSAVAPPRLPSPAAILAGLAECQPAEYAILSGRATEFLWVSKFFRAPRLKEGTALGPGRPRVPAAGKWQPLPLYNAGRLSPYSLFHTQQWRPHFLLIRKPKQNRITGQETAYFLRFNRYG